MQALVWIGAAMAAAGLLGLGWCVREALRFRNVQRAEPLEPAAARKALGRLQAANMAAVGVAFMGLALLAAGVILS